MNRVKNIVTMQWSTYVFSDAEILSAKSGPPGGLDQERIQLRSAMIRDSGHRIPTKSIDIPVFNSVKKFNCSTKS